MRGTGTLKSLSILVAGAGVGAAAGLLYAPQSGKRTRRDLRRRAVDVWDSIDSRIATTRKIVDQNCLPAVHLIQGLGTRLQNGFDRMKKRCRTAS